MIEATRVDDIVKQEWFKKNKSEENPAEWRMYQIGEDIFVAALGPAVFGDLHVIECEGKLVIEPCQV